MISWQINYPSLLSTRSHLTMTVPIPEILVNHTYFMRKNAYPHFPSWEAPLKPLNGVVVFDGISPVAGHKPCCRRTPVEHISLRSIQLLESSSCILLLCYNCLLFVLFCRYYLVKPHQIDDQFVVFILVKS